MTTLIALNDEIASKKANMESARRKQASEIDEAGLNALVCASYFSFRLSCQKIVFASMKFINEVPTVVTNL